MNNEFNLIIGVHEHLMLLAVALRQYLGVPLPSSVSLRVYFNAHRSLCFVVCVASFFFTLAGAEVTLIHAKRTNDKGHLCLLLDDKGKMVHDTWGEILKWNKRRTVEGRRARRLE